MAIAKLRWPLRLYVVAVTAAGLAGGVIAWLLGGVGSADPLAFATLFGLATLGRLHVVHVGTKRKITVPDPAMFGAAIVFTPFAAMVIAGGSSLIGLGVSQRLPLYNRLFNASTSALSMGAAAAVFGASAHPGRAEPTLPIAVAAAIVGYAIKTVTVDVAIGLQLRRNLFANWWTRHRNDLPHHAALYAIGVIGVAVAEANPWALVPLAAATVLVLVVLRESARMRERTRSAIVELADLIDRRDTYTYGHSLRVAHYANRLASRLRMPPAQVETITEAARLHDIGKIGIPDRILLKPGPLDAQEQQEMHRHCDAGYQLLRRMGDFWDGAQLVRCHHERPDGRGYPRGLAGLELPLEASVISVADAYDAMTSDRVYRPALTFDRVMEELRGGRGLQWHAAAVDGLIAMVEEERAVGTTVARPVRFSLDSPRA